MILILTNQYEQNIASVIDELNALGAKYIRLNVDNIEEEQIVMTQGKEFTLNGIHSSELKAIWERKSTLNTKISKNYNYENLINSEKKYFFDYISFVLQDRYWMNPINAKTRTHNSLVQIKIANELGLLPPDTIISNSKNEVAKFWNKHDGQLITKTMCEGSKGELSGKMINTSRVEYIDSCEEAEFTHCPVLFQELIQKELEIRVNYIAGEIVCGAIEIRNSMIDERNQYDTAPMMPYILPQEINQKLIKLNKELGLEFSASDIILDKQGDYRFLECNPSGQWDWMSSKLHLDVDYKIAKALYEKTQ